MKEILFRGKRKDNEQWVEGYYIRDLTHDKHYIFQSMLEKQKAYKNWDYYEVYHKTVGQWTGLEDMHGERIFDGDIVQSACDINEVKMMKACWIIYNRGDWDFLCTNAKSIHVIGNIHDNTEILETQS